MTSQTALSDPVLAFDPGPSLKQRADGKLISRGPGAVVLEDRRDERGAITGRGARRRDALRALLICGAITKRMHDAAERFRDDLSLATTRGLTTNLMRIPTHTGPRSGWPDAQIDALSRVHRVRHLLGFNDGTVFWRVLFLNRSLNDCDAADKRAHGSARDALRAALRALDDWYEDHPRHDGD